MATKCKVGDSFHKHVNLTRRNLLHIGFCLAIVIPMYALTTRQYTQQDFYI